MDTEPTVPEDAMTLIALAGVADMAGFLSEVSSSISIGVSPEAVAGVSLLLAVVALFSSTSMSRPPVVPLVVRSFVYRGLRRLLRSNEPGREGELDEGTDSAVSSNQHPRRIHLSRPGRSARMTSVSPENGQ